MFIPVSKYVGSESNRRKVRWDRNAGHHPRQIQTASNGRDMNITTIFTPKGDGSSGNGHATTEISPCSLRAGLTVISTSCPRAVRKSMRRSTEKAPERLRINAET